MNLATLCSQLATMLKNWEERAKDQVDDRAKDQAQGQIKNQIEDQVEDQVQGNELPTGQADEDDLRFDGYEHWPAYDNKESRSRCRMLGCKNLTHVECTKCGVHLCFSHNRNCFRNYHLAEENE